MEFRTLPFDAMRQENAVAHAETRQQFEGTVNRLSAEFEETTQRLSGEFRETANRLSAENRQYFEIATEAFKGQVQLVAEKVLGLTDDLRREAADIRLEMRTGFGETQAMIRLYCS